MSTVQSIISTLNGIYNSEFCTNWPVWRKQSLLGPLGVEFVDRGLAHPNHCARLCECGGRRSLKVLNMDNAHGPSADTVREFHRAYVGSEEMQRVDAFFFSFPIANFEHFRVFNRSLIIVSPTRYEDMRFDTAQWTALNANLQTLARNNTRHVLAANNQYDAEYIRYFTGLAVDYVQSFCAYPSVSYAPSPTRNAFLLSALRDGLKDKLARLWDEEFTREYKRIGASFELVSKQRKYLYEDLVVFRGIVHVPYQVSIMSILEQYRMNVPLFFPSLELLVDWQFEHWLMTERTWEGVGLKRPRGSYMRAHATQRERPDPNNEWDRRALHYWLKFADFYTLPHIEHFNNVTHLVQLLAQSTAPHLHAISRQMHAHNERVLKQLLIYWRRKLLDIAASSPNRPH